MKPIPTTQTAVEKMKRAAKKMRKETGKPRHECLEVVSKAAGYETWHHVTRCAKESL